MTIIPIPEEWQEKSKEKTKAISAIKKYRLKKKLTQKQLASITGISLGRLQQYEQHSTYLTEERAQIIAQALGVSPKSIMYPFNKRKSTK